LRRRGAKPKTFITYFCALKNLYHCMGWDWSIDFSEIALEAGKFLDAPYLK